MDDKAKPVKPGQLPKSFEPFERLVNKQITPEQFERQVHDFVQESRPRPTE